MQYITAAHGTLMDFVVRWADPGEYSKINAIPNRCKVKQIEQYLMVLINKHCKKKQHEIYVIYNIYRYPIVSNYIAPV